MEPVMNDSDDSTVEGVFWIIILTLVATATGFMIGVVDTAKRYDAPPPPRHVAELRLLQPESANR
jgi:hypothetical protein